MYRTSTVIMSSAAVLLGLALVVRTLSAGGGPFSRGVVLGLLFVVLGGLRLFIAAQTGKQ